MRHAVFGRPLSRDTKARKALLNNLADSLFLYGGLTTTVTKAKFARPYVEKMITLAKKDKLNINRQLASFISTPAFKRLTREIAPAFAQRNGGFTKITKVYPRRGDAAKMAKLELMPYVVATPKKEIAAKPKKVIKNRPTTKSAKTVVKNKSKATKVNVRTKKQKIKKN